MNVKKAFLDIRALPVDQNERTVEFIISSERKDRHGTVLNIEDWVLDAYRKNPIVGYQHDVYGSDIGNNPDNVIGTSEVYRENQLLIGRVKFESGDINPLAEKIYKKVLNGTLRAASVGFLPLEPGHWGTGSEAQGKPNATYYYGKRELLEFSIVNIPSNSDAVRRKLELAYLTGDKLYGTRGNDSDGMRMDLDLQKAGIYSRKRSKDSGKMKMDLDLQKAGIYPGKQK